MFSEFLQLSKKSSFAPNGDERWNGSGSPPNGSGSQVTPTVFVAALPNEQSLECMILTVSAYCLYPRRPD
jgi:hypothetical protein